MDIEVGELEYTLEIGKVNQLTVAAKSSSVISLKLISKNPIDTKYQLYYQLLTSNVEDGLFEGGYLSGGSDDTVGIIQKNAEKVITILFNNLSSRDITIELGTVAGLATNPLKLESGQISLSKEVIQTYFMYSYIGEAQTFVAPVSGNYKIELWGASGNNHYNMYTLQNPSYGGYTAGEIFLNQGTKFYVYVGGKSLPFNASRVGRGSGGATDIRLVSGDWYSISSLASRIMVAGGGGRTYPDISGGVGGSAGGLISYSAGSDIHPVSSATQTMGGEKGNTSLSIEIGSESGSFGIGGGMFNGSYSAGARGYYGGNSNPSGGGGSSYISGHNGCVAITSEEDITPKTGCSDGTTDIRCSYHYSGYRFTDTLMIDGKGYQWTTEKKEAIGQPTYDGFFLQLGNDGDGFAKITRVE